MKMVVKMGGGNDYGAGNCDVCADGACGGDGGGDNDDDDADGDESSLSISVGLSAQLLFRLCNSSPSASATGCNSERWARARASSRIGIGSHARSDELKSGGAVAESDI